MIRIIIGVVVLSWFPSAAANALNWVESCLREAASVSVERWPRYGNGKATDYLSVDHGVLRIAVNLQFRYQHYFSDSEFEQAVKAVEASTLHIEHFYADHGIDLELGLYHARYNAQARNPHPHPGSGTHVIYMRKNTGDHMKSIYWGVNYDWSARKRGQIYTHEFLHLVGLADEYRSDQTSQAAEDNIMNNWWHPSARLYPNQLQQIYSPVCPRLAQSCDRPLWAGSEAASSAVAAARPC